MKQTNDPMRDLAQRLEQTRAAIHENPELSECEYETTKLVRERLRALDLEPVELGLPTGAAALLRGGKPGGTIALRADLDALPIEEATGAPCASRKAGVMHACGHDVHTTVLLGAAELLLRRREELCGNVLLLFQPAEEAATGAAALLERGLLTRVPLDAMLALHVWPGVPEGTVGLRAGAVFSAVNSFKIEVRGRGGHGSSPELVRNPIPPAASLALNLPSIRSNDLPQREAAAVAVTEILGGNCNNVIPDTCTLEGTIRTFSASARDTALRRLEELTEHTAAAWGCTASLTLTDHTPPVINDAHLTQAMEAAARTVFGPDGCRSIAPLMISEDLAFYGERLPICCALLGVGGDRGLHNAGFFPSSAVLLPGAQFLAQSAVNALQMLANAPQEP